MRWATLEDRMQSADRRQDQVFDRNMKRTSPGKRSFKVAVAARAFSKRDSAEKFQPGLHHRGFLDQVKVEAVQICQI